MIDQVLEQYKEQGLLHHYAIRVGRGKAVLLERFHEADAATLFDMASVTKIMATTFPALMALEQGALRLEEPIGRFFPCPPDKQEMKVRHLLTHRVGRLIRTSLKAAYFGAFHPIYSCKAPALLRLNRAKIPRNLLALRSKISKSADFCSIKA